MMTTRYSVASGAIGGVCIGSSDSVAGLIRPMHPVARVNALFSRGLRTMVSPPTLRVSSSSSCFRHPRAARELSPNTVDRGR